MLEEGFESVMMDRIDTTNSNIWSSLNPDPTSPAWIIVKIKSGNRAALESVDLLKNSLRNLIISNIGEKLILSFKLCRVKDLEIAIIPAKKTSPRLFSNNDLTTLIQNSILDETKTTVTSRFSNNHDRFRVRVVDDQMDNIPKKNNN